MIKDKKIYLIDFQGSRRGPIQYDLAALLIDPYVNLPEDIQLQVIDYCASRIYQRLGVEKKSFLNGYALCVITRTLQTLAAFGYLSKIKQKPGFEPYIPVALRNLNNRLKRAGADRFPELTRVAAQALKKINLSFDTKRPAVYKKT